MSKKLFSFFYCVLFVCITQAGLKEDLDQIIGRSKIARSDLSIIVQKTDPSRDILYGLNEGRGLIPASLTKIVTAVSALEVLGPTQTVATKLFVARAPKDGVLNGELIIKGFGDPSFVSETMWVLVNHLSRYSLKEIRGDIWVDSSEFDQSHFDPSREDARVDRAYDAPVSAMSFNWNSVNVYVRPSERSGEPAQVVADPVNGYINVINKTKTSSSGSKNTIAVSRIANGTKDSILVTGNIAVGHPEVVIYKSISNPTLWAGYNLVQFLKEKGITIKGEVKTGVVPNGAFELASVDSVPVSKMVTDMMKFSNNYVAEMLTKLISVSAGAKPGSIGGGLERMRGVLAQMQLPTDQYKLINPSGLTRENRFSAQQLNSILQAAYRNFRIGPEFVNALPVSGRDGTLKSRIRGKGAGWVRAKTGLLNGVVGIAGFAGSSAGEINSFCFIYNGPAGSIEARVRDTFDDMAERLTH